MRNSRSTDNRTSSIIRFFIGLCVLMVLIFVGYYLVAIKDYSYMSDVSAPNVNEWVNNTSNNLAQTNPSIAPAIPGTDEAPRATPVATPIETPVPTPTPIPTATPVPTPVPTKIPEIDLAEMHTKGFKVPDPSRNGNIGISKCYRSIPDAYQVMQLEGWGYVEESYFDGLDCATYLIVTQASTGRQIAYLTTSIAGASGRNHITVAQHPEASDFRVNFSVAQYPDGVYNLGLVLAYKQDGKSRYAYYPFGPETSFSVISGEVIEPVKETLAN